MRKINKENYRKKIKFRFLAIFLVLGVIGMVYQYKTKYEPIIDDVSRLKAKGIITEIVNEAIDENLSMEKYDENLFIIQKNDEGEIQMVQSNTTLINSLVSKFARNLQNKYNSIDERKSKVPLGTILGSKLLSRSDICIDFDILPLSVSKYDFETDFQSEGINQTKYRIYLIIESEVRILKPFSASNFEVSSKVLVAETVIVGKVPGSFVQVPEEDILDVTNE